MGEDLSGKSDGRKYPQNRSFASDLWDFIVTGRRWWLTPVIAVLIFLAAFALIAGLAPVMPFIYTLF